jgi:hypothetical protein
MFIRKQEWTLLDDAIDRAARELNHHDVGSPEYVKILNALSSLTDMRQQEKPKSVSKETLFNVGGNLLGIIMILKHERVNVITSKALSFVLRTRT